MDAETREMLATSPKGVLIVNLDGNTNYTAISLKAFKKQIQNNSSYIVTPLTTAIDNYYCLQGYRLIVQSEGQERCINDMLLGDIDENEKELRIPHNTEKMILSGLYGLEVQWND